MNATRRVKAHHWTLLAVLVSLLIGGAWWWAWASGASEAMAARQASIDDLQRNLLNAKRAQAALPQLRLELLRLEEERRIFLAGLPREADIASVIDDVYKSALGVGVTLNSFSQGRFRPHGNSVWAIPFNATVEGEFSEVMAFVAAMEGLSRYAKIDQVSLSAQHAHSANPTLTGSLGWTVYTFTGATTAVAP
jgi:Tfp pilus assembly protein PilO